MKPIAPQYVTAYRKGNKSDYNDATAIAEAASREDMRFVPVKTQEQQDIQLLHRLRERLVGQRTALSNQVRGLLAEYGIVFPKGISQLRASLIDVIEDAETFTTVIVGMVCAAGDIESSAFLGERVNGKVHGALTDRALAVDQLLG